LKLIERLQQDFIFYVWEKYDVDHAVIRVLTTWSTDFDRVDEFARIVMNWKAE
jgi:threonine aldolase